MGGEGERMLTALHTSMISFAGEDTGKKWLRNVLKMAMKVRYSTQTTTA
jgi:hypothetical protein